FANVLRRHQGLWLRETGCGEPGEREPAGARGDDTRATFRKDGKQLAGTGNRRQCHLVDCMLAERRDLGLGVELRGGETDRLDRAAPMAELQERRGVEPLGDGPVAPLLLD